MKIVLVIFALTVMVNGAWWATAVQPVILSIGAAFAALNSDLQPILDINWRNVLTFKKDKESEKTVAKEEKDDEEEVS